MSSGYTHCACRDCFDVAVSGDMAQSALCSLCREAGCEPYAPDSADYNALPSHMRECQRDDAYGVENEDDDSESRCDGHYDDDDALTSGVGIGEAIYCDGSCRR